MKCRGKRILTSDVIVAVLHSPRFILLLTPIVRVECDYLTNLKMAKYSRVKLTSYHKLLSVVDLSQANEGSISFKSYQLLIAKIHRMRTAPDLIEVSLSHLILFNKVFSRYPLESRGLRQIVIMNRADRNVIEGMLSQL